MVLFDTSMSAPQGPDGPLLHQMQTTIRRHLLEYPTLTPTVVVGVLELLKSIYVAEHLLPMRVSWVHTHEEDEFEDDDTEDWDTDTEDSDEEED
jgi:hypothetical protein